MRPPRPLKPRQRVLITQTEGEGIEISVWFRFNFDDPRAPQIYDGFRLLLEAALPQDERDELLKRIEQARARLKPLAIGGAA